MEGGGDRGAGSAPRERSFTEDSQDEFADVDMSSILDEAALSGPLRSSLGGGGQARTGASCTGYSGDPAPPPPPPLAEQALSPPTPPRFNLRQEVRTLKQQRLAVSVGHDSGVARRGLFGLAKTSESIGTAACPEAGKGDPPLGETTVLEKREDLPEKKFTAQISESDEVFSDMKLEASSPSAHFALGFGSQIVAFSSFEKLSRIVQAELQLLGVSVRPQFTHDPQWDACVFTDAGEFCHFYVDICCIKEEEHAVIFSFVSGGKFEFYAIIRRVADAIQRASCPVYVHGMDGRLIMKGPPAPVYDAHAPPSRLGLPPPPSVRPSAKDQSGEKGRSVCTPRRDSMAAMLCSSSSRTRMEGAKSLIEMCSNESIRSQLCGDRLIWDEVVALACRTGEEGYVRTCCLRAIAVLAGDFSISKSLYESLIQSATQELKSSSGSSSGWLALEIRRQSARLAVLLLSLPCCKEATTSWMNRSLIEGGKWEQELMGFIRQAVALSLDEYLSGQLKELLTCWYDIMWGHCGMRMASSQPDILPDPWRSRGVTFITVEGDYHLVLATIGSFCQDLGRFEMMGAPAVVTCASQKPSWTLTVFRSYEFCKFDATIWREGPSTHKVFFNLHFGEKRVFYLAVQHFSAAVCVPGLRVSRLACSDQVVEVKSLHITMCPLGLTNEGPPLIPLLPCADATEYRTKVNAVCGMIGSQHRSVRLEGLRLLSFWSENGKQRETLCSSLYSFEKIVEATADIAFGRSDDVDDIVVRVFGVFSLSNLCHIPACKRVLRKKQLAYTEATACAAALCVSMGVARRLSEIFGAALQSSLASAPAFVSQGWT
jgi:hypothetical protein